MITSIPKRNEVKQILQIMYQDEEITDEMINNAIIAQEDIPFDEEN